ncbi:MAG: hypothetical protein ABFD16_26135 [Thermoguttaceae bacterium]|jgi:hypothetical protein
MSSSGRLSRRAFGAALLGACGTLSAGCGLLLYPERRGQRGGRLDWGVVLLDGLGLLLFFIPGIIAFVVDFSTGTIYLPPERYPYGQTQPDTADESLVSVHVPREELTRERIEAVASRHAGRPVSLADDACQTEPLHDLKEFWRAVARRTTDTA